MQDDLVKLQECFHRLVKKGFKQYAPGKVRSALDLPIEKQQAWATSQGISLSEWQAKTARGAVELMEATEQSLTSAYEQTSNGAEPRWADESIFTGAVVKPIDPSNDASDAKQTP